MAPNIDVVLYRTDGSVVGIECKFCEPYGHRQEFGELHPKYFPELGNPQTRGRWSAEGLPQTQLVARQVGRDIRCKHLDAGQLLKHILGLARHVPASRPVQLVYLWFDATGPAAELHRLEIEEFAQRMAIAVEEVDLRAITYQDLFSALSDQCRADDQYLARLGERYFRNASR
jgi:hypothetical protein